MLVQSGITSLQTSPFSSYKRTHRPGIFGMNRRKVNALAEKIRHIELHEHSEISEQIYRDKAM